MIYCKELKKEFQTKELLFKALIENKAEIISLKKSVIKETDGFSCLLSDSETEKSVVTKGNDAVIGNPTELKTRVVMNTTNVYDSHGDVHIDGLWKRSLNASNSKLHLQEHKQQFDKVIANDAKAYTKKMDLADLWPGISGPTQALLFDTLVKQSRNPFMFDQYKNGWVNNHSVGMAYVDILMAVNSEEKWAEEYKENWDKYYPIIANKNDVDDAGYFWPVLEAKLIEGSAVLFGSNFATPTLENNMKSEQQISPSDEPAAATQQINKFINPNLF